jgi:peptide/nickel transport system substrate-binding protein
MITRRHALALLGGTLLPHSMLGAAIAASTPAQDAATAALPPLAERLPKNPRVIKFAG